MMKLLLLLLLGFSILLSAPAFHEKKTFDLSNNETFSGYVKGDEHLNWIESEEGEILLFSKQNNRYEYALIKKGELVPSGIEKEKSMQHKRAFNDLFKEEVLNLWKTKRDREFQRRRHQP
jgi:hypothetical protein